jgi:hypothetical protein
VISLHTDFPPSLTQSVLIVKVNTAWIICYSAPDTVASGSTSGGAQIHTLTHRALLQNHPSIQSKQGQLDDIVPIVTRQPNIMIMAH